MTPDERVKAAADVCPCPTPAEILTLRAERDAARAALEGIIPRFKACLIYAGNDEETAEASLAAARTALAASAGEGE